MENTSNIYRLFTYLLLLSEAFNQRRYGGRISDYSWSWKLEPVTLIKYEFKN